MAGRGRWCACAGDDTIISGRLELERFNVAQFDTVTVLAQQGDYEGLQVAAPGGEWISVPIIPGALQVFSGTLLARRTGGRLRPADTECWRAAR